ncbi:uncharacterized protein LOC105395940 isoform X3 [Plutella xylostella]|uniref:uncharacterized protein LOC105395940 isoform X3 n=1 Tax=Plutella xylostella TaxID=51655 RepID=UPI002032795F|nr:uncharacterized protein LOC105395940 isoform X3 [Plutella xylostella]
MKRAKMAKPSAVFQVYPVSSSESSSSSSSSASNSDTRLRRFNRLLRTAVARHWSQFRRVRPIKTRGRSISDTGLCSIVDDDSISQFCSLEPPPRHGSFQVINLPTELRISPSSSAGSGAAEESDGSDGERPRRVHLRAPTPAYGGLSTGNFAAGAAGGGCGAPRSAPATPLQLEPHPRHMKHDKQAVKPLSTSVPSVRAPGQGGALSDASEGKQPSKARQNKFLRHFPQVGPDEKVLNYYSCALVGDILLQGHLYITRNYFAFYSNVFGYVTKLLIPTSTVLRVTKEKMARIIPNAVGVCTVDSRHVFGSLLSRDSTYKLMTSVWKAARSSLSPPDRTLRCETEPDASELSVEDETSSAGGGDVTDARHDQPPPTPLNKPHSSHTTPAAVIQPALLTGTPSLVQPNNDGLTRYLLIAVAFLLAVSALFLAVKLYFGAPKDEFEDELSKLSGSELYSELVRWRARLHGRAATELQAFLTTNLLLLTKVRQSLEALSGVILTDMAQGNNMNLEIPPNETAFS